jgi:predicted nucleotidyltransferase
VYPSIDEYRSDIAAPCRRYGVRRLDVLGSAARATDSDPETSDGDFRVLFDAEKHLPPLEQLFGLAEDLKQLFKRPVDLIEFGAVRNPFIRERFLPAVLGPNLSTASATCR